MAYLNFYTGPATGYPPQPPGGGVYQCTDSGNTYVFGVLNSSTQITIINLAFTALPENGSTHTLDQSQYDQLRDALVNGKVIYVRTACNMFVVHSISDSGLYNGSPGNSGVVDLYFHFNMGNTSALTTGTTYKDVNGHIKIDMTQTPDEEGEYSYTVYIQSPYYVLDKITTSIDDSFIDRMLMDYSGDNYNHIDLSTTYTVEELQSILNDVNNNDTKLVIKTNIFNNNENREEYLVFRKCEDNLYDSNLLVGVTSTILECNINLPYNVINDVYSFGTNISKQNGFFVTYNIPTLYLAILINTNSNDNSISSIRLNLISKPDLSEGILYIGPDLIIKSETEDNTYYISNLINNNSTAETPNNLNGSNSKITSSYYNLVKITKSVFSSLSVIFKLPNGKIIKTRPTTSYEMESIFDGATIEYDITISDMFFYNKSKDNTNPELSSFIISYGQYMISFSISYSTSYNQITGSQGNKYNGKIVLL